jgi:hypothetical protein
VSAEIDLPFRVPYPRPTTLSDPTNDHPEESLVAILAKGDRFLDWCDYSRLFSFCPAGSYEESVYFLPRALAAIDQEIDGLYEFKDSVFLWIAQHSALLERDRVLRDACCAISQSLLRAAARFDIEYDDGTRGDLLNTPGIPDPGMVPRAFDVVDTLGNLYDTRTLRGVADEFSALLLRAPWEPIRAAWTLELARRAATDSQFRECLDESRPNRWRMPSPPPRAPDIVPLPDLLRDAALLRAAWTRLRRDPFVTGATSIGYWLDVVETLDL